MAVDADTGGNERVYQVSEITNLVKATLEANFPHVVIEGEISNFKASGAGHMYFSLKDENAVIQAVLFRGRARRLSFEPEDGMLVRARGGISLYPKRGNYQIIVEDMQVAGMGRLLAMLERRKQSLAAEGLFAPERKKPLPAFPERIAVVTSPTGAAIRDFVQVLGRRNAGIDVVVVPAPVQGAEAPGKLAAQLARADRYDLGEVIVLTRGGGSLEDLLAFSDEQVVRTVAALKTPVISAVGHEVDTALSDLAADVRAPTPSAAAEMVSARQIEVRQRVLDQGRAMIYALNAVVRRARIAARQFTPASLQQHFRNLLQPYLQRLDDDKESLVHAAQALVRQERARVTGLAESLEAVSPKRVLRRGYAIVRSGTERRVVTDASHLSVGDAVAVEFAESAFDAEVTSRSTETTDERRGTTDESEEQHQSE
jgi:exodeoxyribonuclease VII large subunit